MNLHKIIVTDCDDGITSGSVQIFGYYFSDDAPEDEEVDLISTQHWESRRDLAYIREDMVEEGIIYAKKHKCLLLIDIDGEQYYNDEYKESGK